MGAFFLAASVPSTSSQVTRASTHNASSNVVPSPYHGDTLADTLAGALLQSFRQTSSSSSMDTLLAIQGLVNTLSTSFAALQDNIDHTITSLQQDNPPQPIAGPSGTRRTPSSAVMSDDAAQLSAQSPANDHGEQEEEEEEEEVEEELF